MADIEQPTYLSLSEASRLLGVHRTTLRRWADAGTVRVYTTPGGHRRFALDDIEALSTNKTLESDALARLWAKRALAQARSELQRVEQSPSWLAHLEEHERQTWRRVSLQLMGLVLRYVGQPDHEDESPLLAEAQAIGDAYASYALRSRVPLSTALEVALFFRDSLVDAVMSMPEQVNLSNEASTRLLRRIRRVLNVVELAVVAGYEHADPHLHFPENDTPDDASRAG